MCQCGTAGSGGLHCCNSCNLVVKKLLSRANLKKKRTHTEAPFINGNKVQLTPKRRGSEPSFGPLKPMHLFFKKTQGFEM